MTDTDLLQEISGKLDKLIGIFAIQGVEEENKKIRILNELGFSHGLVGTLIGISANAVEIRVRKAKKKKAQAST